MGSRESRVRPVARLEWPSKEWGEKWVSIDGKEEEFSLGQDELAVSAWSRMTALLQKDKPGRDGVGGGIVRGEDGSRELVQSPGKGEEGLASTFQTAFSSPASKACPTLTLSLLCYLSCLCFLKACQIFDYIQEISKCIEPSLREGIKSIVRKDQALLRQRGPGKPKEI